MIYHHLLVKDQVPRIHLILFNNFTKKINSPRYNIESLLYKVYPEKTFHLRPLRLENFLRDLAFPRKRSLHHLFLPSFVLLFSASEKKKAMFPTVSCCEEQPYSIYNHCLTTTPSTFLFL